MNYLHMTRRITMKRFPASPSKVGFTIVHKYSVGNASVGGHYKQCDVKVLRSWDYYKYVHKTPYTYKVPSKVGFDNLHDCIAGKTILGATYAAEYESIYALGTFIKIILRGGSVPHQAFQAAFLVESTHKCLRI